MPIPNDVAAVIARLERDIMAKIEAATSTAAASRHKTAADRFWDVAVRFVVPVTVGVLVYQLTLGERVLTIEQTRITALEAQQKLSALEQRIMIAAEGPSWLRSDMATLSVKLDTLKENLAKVSERVVRVEADLKR
jgi:hypothetical protein